MATLYFTNNYGLTSRDRLPIYHDGKQIGLISSTTNNETAVSAQLYDCEIEPISFNGEKIIGFDICSNKDSNPYGYCEFDTDTIKRSHYFKIHNSYIDKKDLRDMFNLLKENHSTIEAVKKICEVYNLLFNKELFETVKMYYPSKGLFLYLECLDDLKYRGKTYKDSTFE